jgi:hypothetical protein
MRPQYWLTKYGGCSILPFWLPARRQAGSLSAMEEVSLLHLVHADRFLGVKSVRSTPSRLLVATVGPALFCERGKFRQFADVARIVLDNERRLQIR